MTLSLKGKAKDDRQWIGCDLDGTLAHYDEWSGIEHIGKPVPKMLERVKKWIAEGKIVKIVTARVMNGSRAIKYIENWLEENGIGGLEVTNEKDMKMVELWDDRVVQVEKNTGERVDGKED